VNGLRHRQLDPPPDRVREERNHTIFNRLVAASLPIEEEEALKELDCCIFREPLGKPEPAIRLPCGHYIGAQCIGNCIKHWDKESALRVCTLCNKGFDLTVIGDDPLEDPINWPGYEPAPAGVISTAWQVKQLIDRAIWESSRVGTHKTESPWWMRVLKNRAL
jgi:hypothetical protein